MWEQEAAKPAREPLNVFYQPRPSDGPPAPLPCETEQAPVGSCVISVQQAGQEGWWSTAQLVYGAKKGVFRWGESTLADYFLAMKDDQRADLLSALTTAHSTNLSAPESEDMVLFVEHVLAMEQGLAVAGVDPRLVKQYQTMLLLMAQYLDIVQMVDRGHALFRADHGFLTYARGEKPIAALTAAGQAVARKIQGAMGHHFGGGSIIKP